MFCSNSLFKLSSSSLLTKGLNPTFVPTDVPRFWSSSHQSIHLPVGPKNLASDFGGFDGREQAETGFFSWKAGWIISPWNWSLLVHGKFVECDLASLLLTDNIQGTRSSAITSKRLVIFMKWPQVHCKLISGIVKINSWIIYTSILRNLHNQSKSRPLNYHCLLLRFLKKKHQSLFTGKLRSMATTVVWAKGGSSWCSERFQPRFWGNAGIRQAAGMKNKLQQQIIIHLWKKHLMVVREERTWGNMFAHTQFMFAHVAFGSRNRL